MSTGEDDLTDDIFRKIVAYIYREARISLSDGKRELVRARFGKLIRARQMSGFREYYKWMESDTTGEAVREVLNAIATNLTSFFRENKHFDFMAKEMIPEFLRKKSDREHKIRGWSAGCSAGDEPYTIAIVLRENITDINRWDVKLLATDLDTNILQEALRGLYRQDRVAPVPPQYRSKYLHKIDDPQGNGPLYEVDESLRRLISFRHLNLMHPWPFRHKFDFIFCRNVMIYFDKKTQEELVNRYYDVLTPGGYLFIGHSESLTGLNHPFLYASPTIYRKKEE